MNVASTLPRYAPLEIQDSEINLSRTSDSFAIRTIRNSFQTLSSICTTTTSAVGALGRWVVKNPIAAGIGALATLAFGATLFGAGIEEGLALANNTKKNDGTFDNNKCQVFSTLKIGMNKDQSFSIRDMRGEILAQLNHDEISNDSAVFIDASDYCAEGFLEKNLTFQCNEDKLFAVEPRHFDRFSREILETDCKPKNNFKDIFFGKLEKDQQITVRKLVNDEPITRVDGAGTTSGMGDTVPDQSLDASGNGDFYLTDSED